MRARFLISNQVHVQDMNTVHLERPRLNLTKGHSTRSCCLCVFVAVVVGGVVFNARVVPVGSRKFREDISTKLRNSATNAHISGHLDMLLNISLTRYIGFN